ncbi:hypothetical protein JCM8097_004028 [Rhodosporidiobolus ruineniae]
MLDRLPPSLLHRILRFAAPLNIGEEWPCPQPEAYTERRRTLMRICLVNKQLCALAQPMLPEVFYVINERQEQHARKLGKYIKRLKILHREAAVSATLHGCTALEEARLGFDRPDAKAMAAVQNVKYLGFHYIIPTSPFFPFFPHLVTLSFHHVKLAISNAQYFFTSNRFPSLRNLGLGQIIYPAASLDDEKLVTPGVDSALAARLRIFITYDQELVGLQVSSAAFKGILGAIFEVQGPFGGSITPPRQIPLSHMQFRIPDFEADIFSVLETYTTAYSTLKTVQLPRRLHPSRAEPDLERASETFVEEHQRRGIEILWTEFFDQHDSPLVSPELVDWAVAEHERVAAAAANEV